MAYTLRYHPRVADQDLKKLAPASRRRIQRAIEDRLGVAPERYASPLAGTLRGYSKLRVGDYRVIFRVTGEEVRIVVVAHRKDAYEWAQRRLGS